MKKLIFAVAALIVMAGCSQNVTLESANLNAELHVLHAQYVDPTTPDAVL